VLDTLWKKPLPNKLFHLERVARRPDNLPLPTSATSLTWREVIHKLSTGLLWPVCHAQTSTAWPQQPIGKMNTGFLTGSTTQNGLTVESSGQGIHAQARSAFPNNPRLFPEIHTGFWFSTEVFTGSLRARHRLHGSQQRCTRILQNNHRPSPPPVSELHEGLLQTSSHPSHSGSYRVEWRRRNPSHGSSQPFSACARVDTCHPWYCMRSTSTRSSHHLGNHVSFQKDLG
jgi:hypothetical protein